ncbi:MAG: DNA primase catalytic subunit PriS [archaeon]|nr:DNA primase catalytic subunit PriS [archaeon]
MDSNSRFLLKTFRKYYMDNPVIMPGRFTRREFGFMFFDGNFVQRHLQFSNSEDLGMFMIARVPSHSYYSTAYYRRPDAPTMEEKVWLGSDLIFDLDADHLDGADNMTYSEMLVQIKKEVINLVDSFLFGDLGFDDSQVTIQFSGGRGYHVHVERNDVLNLGTHERREIVNYITSSGLDIDWIFSFDRCATSNAKMNDLTYSNVKKYRTIPSEDSGGWKLRMRNGLKDVVDDICGLDVNEIKKLYPSTGTIKKESIEKYKMDLIKSEKIIFKNNKMITLKEGTQEFLVKIMAEDVAHRLSGKVDEPVTADIKRLIRLPGSIHGKTGFRVLPLTRDELTDFDPLVSAVPSQYSDDDVMITMKKNTEITIKGQHFKLDGTVNVPEYAAVFLIGRKMADIGDVSTKETLF